MKKICYAWLKRIPKQKSTVFTIETNCNKVYLNSLTRKTVSASKTLSLPHHLCAVFRESKRRTSKYESKNKLPLRVKGPKVTNQLKSLWFDPFRLGTGMRDDWFQRGCSLPSPPSAFSKSYLRKILCLLINRVARSFVNQMHLNGFPPPSSTAPSPSCKTAAYNLILKLNPCAHASRPWHTACLW